jgi:tetratricopeptide (TPR) repeat protein/CheY-like chemotaxis protein
MQGRDGRDTDKLDVTATLREASSNGTRTSDVRFAPRFVGATRIGRYQLEAELGAGAYGVVYRALDLDRGLPVAVKLLHYFGSHRLVRFKSEFRVTAELSHPNLLPLYELVAEGDHFIIAMELVEGVEFMPYVRQDGVCDEQRLRRTVGQICDGLDALHAADVLHRDLKPSNVLVRADGDVRIVDFGLATLAQRTKSTGRSGEHFVVGSPAYMAPEQALSRPMGPAADLYALGVMMYEALTGALPFDGPTLTVLTQKNIVDAPDPAERAPFADGGLLALVRALLLKDPDKRPRTDEVRARLAYASGETRIVSRPPEVNRSLIGRSEELDTLAAAFVRATNTRPVLQRVEGRSGVGKSALLRGLERRLREQHGALVLEGRCHALESIPHKGIDAIIDGLRDHLVSLRNGTDGLMVPANIADAIRMFPVLADLRGAHAPASTEQVSPDDLRRRAHDAVAELFFEVAETKPIAIILDDAQWGDIDGARLLERLITDPMGQRIFVVLAYRDDEATDSELLDHIAQIPQSERRYDERTLSLSKISDEDAVSMALGMLKDRDVEVARRIAEEARGEPFFVEQLALERGEVEQIVGGLDDVVRGRCRRFGDAAVRMLEVACIAGHPLSERLLAVTADVADPRPLLARLTSASLLRRTGSGPDARIYPYHDRVRVALVADIDDGRTRGLHRALAQFGEAEASMPAALIAEHFERAGDETRAAPHAFHAAQLAEQGLAFDLAAEAYGRAIALDPASQDRVQRAREGRARCLLLAGRCDEAGTAFLEAALDAEPEAKRRFEQQAGEAWLVCGRVHDGLHVLLPLLAREGLPYPNDMPGIVRALLYVIARARLRTMSKPKLGARVDRALLARAEIAFGIGKGLLSVAPAQGTILALESLVLGLRARDERAIARGLGFAGCGFAPFTHAVGPRYLGWAGEIAERLDDDHLRTTLLIAKSVRGLLAGDWATAIASGKDALTLARRTPAPTAWEETLARTSIVSALEYQGELGEMERLSRVFLRDTRERGDAMTLVMVISALGYPTAAKHDDVELDRVIAEMAGTIAGWSVESGLWDLYLLRLRVLRTLCWARSRPRARSSSRRGPAWRRSVCSRCRSRAVRPTSSAPRWSSSRSRTELATHARSCATPSAPRVCSRAKTAPMAPSRLP